MTLNRLTKTDVQPGDYLRFVSGQTYIVTCVSRFKSGGIAFTIQDVKTRQTIYAYPSSQLYGAEIIKA